MHVDAFSPAGAKLLTDVQVSKRSENGSGTDDGDVTDTSSDGGSKEPCERDLNEAPRRARANRAFPGSGPSRVEARCEDRHENKLES
jgi:hypothetical protein